MTGLPMTCLDCPSPAAARGYCTRCYQAHRRAGDFPAREATVKVALRVPESTHAALERAARRERGTLSSVALRVLGEWARK